MSSQLMLHPFRAKADARLAAKVQTEDGSSDQPATKKVCAAYDKQMQKMEGDVSLVKDMGIPSVSLPITYV